MRDSGAGIPADLLPRVFEPFVQADRSLERSRGGLGIGLTLVKKIVELHHGQVSAQSDGLGQRQRVRDPSAGAWPAAGRRRRAARRRQPPCRAFPVRILVVDDNVDAAESLAMLLQTDGHTVSVAHNGMDAVQRAESWRPGHRRARRRPARHERLRGGAACCGSADECPELIAVTGYGQAADTRRALDAGFRFHLVKPVDARDLTAAIAQCASARAGNRASARPEPRRRHVAW